MAETTICLFLSYGRADASELALRLERDLAQAGYKVWRDTMLHPGPGWDAQIEAAIAAADILIAILSPHATRRAGDVSGSVQDSVCLDEIAAARFGEHPIPIIPVLAKPTAPPLLLIRRQWLDFSNTDADSALYEDRLAELIATIRDVTAGMPPSEEDPHVFDFGALFESKLVYFAGREWLLDITRQWVADAVGERLLLVAGEPGIGKSTLVARMVQTNFTGTVAAYHAFRTARRSTLDPAQVIESIAGMLGRTQAGFDAWHDRLKNQGEMLSQFTREHDPQSAWEDGILAFFPKSASQRQLILFDALDEAQMHRGEISFLEVLANSLDAIPQSMCIIATTRREQRVLSQFGGMRVTQIDADDEQNQEDLKRYIGSRLSGGAREQAARAVISRANGSFLVARLIIDEYEIVGEQALESRGALAAEYTRAFRRRFPRNSELDKLKALMAIVAASYEAASHRDRNGQS